MFMCKLPTWPDVFLKALNEEYIHQSFLSSSSFTLSISSLPLVYAFANVLRRCGVTMVSNVSDSSDAWPGMLLHAHMLQHSLMPHRAGHTHTHAHAHAHTYACTIHKKRYGSACMLYSSACIRRVCLQECKRGCLSGRNSCSFLREKRNFLLPHCKPRPVSQDINQSAMLRLNAGS